MTFTPYSTNIYVCMPRKIAPVQISILDIIDGNIKDEKDFPVEYDKSYTVTRKLDIESQAMYKNNMHKAIRILERLLEKYDRLFHVDPQTLYRHFQIPKKSGGWRQIDAPNCDLSAYHAELVKFFKEELTVDKFKNHYALHHTSAYAYVKNRCTKDALIRHQYNNSRWYAKTDFSNFFGSTTLEFVMQQLSMIYPISTLMKDEDGRKAMQKALSLCFLNGGLPQGTKMSPMLTNLIMIPIDHALSNEFHKLDNHGNRYVYTRYADDILLSAKHDFPLQEKVDVINRVLKEFNAPYTVKPEKLRYGSTAGRNWNLGLMINKDNEITVGAENINQMKAAIHNFIMDHLNDKPWDRLSVQQFQGRLEYYRFIQKDRMDSIIEKYNTKYNVDLIPMIRMVLKNC